MNIVKNILMAMIVGNSIIYTAVWNTYGKHWSVYVNPLHTGFCLLALWFALTMMEWDLGEKTKKYQFRNKNENIRGDEGNEGIY